MGKVCFQVGILAPDTRSGFYRSPRGFWVPTAPPHIPPMMSFYRLWGARRTRGRKRQDQCGRRRGTVRNLWISARGFEIRWKCISTCLCPKSARASKKHVTRRGFYAINKIIIMMIIITGENKEIIYKKSCKNKGIMKNPHVKNMMLLQESQEKKYRLKKNNHIMEKNNEFGKNLQKCGQK